MERRPAVRRVAVGRVVATAAGWLLAAGVAGAALAAPPPHAVAAAPAPAPTAAPVTHARPEPDVMVLVVGEGSPAGELDAIDVKRLFLGIPVVAGGANLHALMNTSDARLLDLFYQHVVGMTDATYEHRTLELTLEQGRRMPPRIDDAAALFARLHADPLAVSYAWRSQVATYPGLRIVRELWHP